MPYSLHDLWLYAVLGFQLEPHHLILIVIFALITMLAAGFVCFVGAMRLLHGARWRGLKDLGMGIPLFLLPALLSTALYAWIGAGVHRDLSDPRLALRSTTHAVELIVPSTQTVEVQGERVALPAEVRRSFTRRELLILAEAELPGRTHHLSAIAELAQRSR